MDIIMDDQDNEQQNKSKGVNLLEKKKLKCVIAGCEAVFTKPSCFEAHLRFHVNDRPYKCTFEGCDKSYTRSQHLKRHYKNHVDAKEFFNCLQCSLITNNLSNLKRHIKRVHSENVLTCLDCGLKFRKKHRLEEHMFSHNKILLYECDKCYLNFPSKFKLNRHKRGHEVHKYKCPEEDCKKIFKKQSSLIKHKLDHEKENRCIVCNELLPLFCKKKFCSIHNQSDLRPELKFTCPYESCSKIYSFKRNLKSHIKIRHLKENYECDICKSLLVTKQKLVHHIKSKHDFPKPIKKSTGPKKIRKDAGKPRISMLSKLSGIKFLPTTEGKLMNRDAVALNRDKTISDDNPSDTQAIFINENCVKED